MGGTQIQAHEAVSRCIAVLDVGTTAVKACLFSPSLELLACSVQEYALRTQGERVEADAAQYKAAARAGLADALSQAPGCIPAAVSITTQGETLTLADRSGEPLRPFLVWLDSRAENEAQALRSVLDNETFYKTTGLPEVTGALPLAKLLWLRKHEPDTFARAHKLLLLEDYLLHSSDMDLAKPINWKRMRAANGEYGCMGDLGIHTQHLPFRLGFSPRTVSAQLANIAKTRPDENGMPVPCETWDNAVLMCEAQNTAGDTFPMQLEMKRMAPGCTNTVEYEIYGLNLSARFTTDDPNAIHYTQAVGREQAWARLVIGQKTLYPVITGSIFEFGFSDSLLQMFAAFVSELRGLPCSFGCFTPAEAHLSHRVLTAALESYTQKRVVTLE